MRRTLLAGAILAVVAALLVNYGGALGLELSRFALLGAALGAVLGMVPAPSAIARAGGFAVGFVAAWGGYAIRAAVLPDTATGRAVAALVVILLVTLVCGLTAGRVPLWSALLGIGALAGAYEVTFSNAPTAFTTDSMTAATTVALAAALGFVATAFIGGVLHPDDDDVAASPVHHDTPAPGVTVVDNSKGTAS